MAPAAYSIADGSQWRSNRHIIEAMYNLNLDILKDRRDADTKLANDILDPNIRAFALSNLAQDAVTKKLSWKCNLKALLANLDAMASWEKKQQSGFFNGPTLFLAGANSRYIRGNVHLDAIKSSFPNFALRTVPNAGHWIHAEQPETTQDFVREFLDTSWQPPQEQS
uniref:AB hydrolase-1 domain-containing protein n=1 Tax=Aureoumbra lagunensis TaxID=44058 RepID=A0A7S3JV39_9STRA